MSREVSARRRLTRQIERFLSMLVTYQGNKQAYVIGHIGETEAFGRVQGFAFGT